MRRKLTSIATVLSLLVSVATVALWVRSYQVYDTFEWTRSYRTRFIAILGGRILLQVNHAPSGTKEFESIDHDAHVLRANDNMDMGRPWRFGGFWMENLTFAPATPAQAPLPYTDVVVPLYAVLALGLALPGLTLRRVIRVRLRHAGVCRACGYDLRATPDRCPECGAMSGEPPHNPPMQRTGAAV